MTRLRLLRARWRALRDSIRPALHEAFLIFDTRYQEHRLDVYWKR